MANNQFLIPEYTSGQGGRHPTLLGFEPEIIDVQVGFPENLVQDLVGLLSWRSGLKDADRDIDGQSAGDLAGAQSSNAIGDCCHRTINEPVVLTFELPNSNAILIVMTNRPRGRTSRKR
jgi:hypothetical protein